MAQRAISLGPKPSFLCYCLAFLTLLLIEKPWFFALKRAICVHCSVFPFVSLKPFWLASPFFTFSFFASLLLLSFFLVSCFSFLFLVLAFYFVVFAFLFQDVILFLFLCLLFCLESQS